MAENPIVQEVQLELERVKSDPMNLIFKIFFGLGFLSILVQIDWAGIAKAIPSLGVIFLWLDNLFNNAAVAGGWIVKLFVIGFGIILAMLVFTGMLRPWNEEFFKIRLAWFSFVLILAITILLTWMLPTILPEFFKQAPPALSVLVP